MADTGLTLAGTGTQTNLGSTEDWDFPENITNESLRTNCSHSDDTFDTISTRLQLMDSSGLIGDNKENEDSQWAGGQETVQIGGSTDGWNASLTPSIVNSSSFGFAVEIDMNPQMGDVELATSSSRLEGTNFGFNIPAGSSIDGVILEMRRRTISTVSRFFHIKLQIFYTEGAGGSAVQNALFFAGGA